MFSKHILVAVQQQGRHVDAWKHVAQVRFAKGERHCLEPGRMRLARNMTGGGPFDVSWFFSMVELLLAVCETK